MRKAVSAVFISVFAVAFHAAFAATFQFNTNCKTAYAHCLALRLPQAASLLNAEMQAGNLCADYLSNYLDFFTLLASEDEQRYEACRAFENERLEKLSDIPEGSPYHLFARAEVLLQWAILHIRFGNYTDGLFSLRKSYLLIEKNEQRFPGFLPNKKTLGVLYILLGSVPDNFQWAVKLMGMKGNMNDGILLLKSVAENKADGNLFREESELMYALLMMNLGNKKEEAWQYLKQQGHPLPNHLMSSYAMAFLGVYARHTDEAIQIILKRPYGKEYIDFPFFYYLLGLAKTNRMDADAATYLQYFVGHYRGKNNLRAAYQKLAWCHFLKGDSATYQKQMQQLLQSGSEAIDADKQASYEARSGTWPQATLLRARVLSDGGYFEKALQQILKVDESQLNSSERVEYLYRSGKVHAGLNDTAQALAGFRKAAESGKNQHRYFAASAAYEAGFIFEGKGDLKMAQQYYRLCLTAPDHEYKNSMDQKAKAALQRIEK